MPTTTMRTSPSTQSGSDTPQAVGVAVLARTAILGRGKRRLAATLGDEATLAIYRDLIGACAKTVSASGLPATVYFEPEVGDRDVWPPSVFAYARQPPEADLGERMRFAAADSLARRDGGVLLIGTDCPSLTPQLLRAAAEALVDYDAVLGPSTDGGYYLLGLRALRAEVFEGIPWSTASVAEDTRRVLAEADLSTWELPPLSDIDTAGDWEAHLAAHKA